MRDRALLTSIPSSISPHSLPDVDISGCDQLTDAALESIGQLISLRRLNLRGCALISDRGLAHLVTLKVRAAGSLYFVTCH